MDVDDVKELNGGYTTYNMKEKRKREARHVWDDFVSHSTLHGLHYAFEKRPAPQRCIWFIFLALMGALFTWQTSILVLKYFAYNVSTTMELVAERESRFPAVTLCNFNRYRKSLKINYTEFYEVLGLEHPLYKAEKKAVNWTKYTTLKNLSMTKLIGEAGHQMKYDNKTKTGMLYRCTWRGKECQANNFTKRLTDMGLCYTFNSGKDGEILEVNAPGKYFGLHLRMSVDQREYIANTAFSAGLRMRIHDPDEPPLVSSLGFAVMPGSHVFASISRQKTVSLKRPYKTMCEDQKLPGIKSYTIAACHETCKAHAIAKECKCEAFYMRDTGFNSCTVEKYFSCVTPLEERFSSASMMNGCRCTEPCETMKYSVYLSYGAFPSIEASRAYAKNSSTEMERFKNDLLAIDIFYEDLNYNVIKQVPAYSLQNLLGEIGGLMGLFLGASILTLFEFFDLLIMGILARLGIHNHF